ncbi:MAG: hypothetical protein ACI8ZO_001485 [Flavobacteriales bacterium]|jgi:hypothetical protein
MKKIIALSIVCLSSIVVFGQKKFNLGLQASPNLSWVKSDILDSENKVGLKFNYGLITEIQLAENYLLSTGIGHGYDGGKLTAELKEDTTSAIQVDYAAQFINIPFMLKMRTKEIGYMRYFALFGITTGIKVGETITSEEYQDKIETDVNYINLFKASLSIGVGAEYSLGGDTRFMAGLIFNNNFTNMLDKDNSLLMESASKNAFSNVALTVGILF